MSYKGPARRFCSGQLWATAGDWTKKRLVHCCRYGCCASREECVEKLMSSIDTLLLCWLPKVPALNRWTRLYQPLAWWTVAFGFFTLIPICLMALKGCQRCTREPCRLSATREVLSIGLVPLPLPIVIRILSGVGGVAESESDCFPIRLHRLPEFPSIFRGPDAVTRSGICCC